MSSNNTMELSPHDTLHSVDPVHVNPPSDGVLPDPALHDVNDNQVVVHETPSMSPLRQNYAGFDIPQQGEHALEYVYDGADEEPSTHRASSNKMSPLGYAMPPAAAAAPLSTTTTSAAASNTTTTNNAMTMNEAPHERTLGEVQPSYQQAAAAATSIPAADTRDVAQPIPDNFRLSYNYPTAPLSLKPQLDESRVAYDGDGNLLVMQDPQPDAGVSSNQPSYFISPALAAAAAGEVAPSSNPLSNRTIRHQQTQSYDGAYHAYEPASVTQAGNGVIVDNGGRHSISIHEDNGGVFVDPNDPSYTKALPIVVQASQKLPLKQDSTTSLYDTSNTVYPYPYACYMTGALSIFWVIMFLVEFGTDSWHMEDPYINPALGPSYSQLDHLGGLLTFKVLGHAHYHTGSLTKETHRIFTTLLWHAGIIHFLPSLFGLIWTGSWIEREYGPIRLFLIFWITGLFGSIFSAIFVQDLLTVSASACVFGLLGAKIVDIILHHPWFKRSFNMFHLFQVLFFVGVGIVIGLLPLIDNWAHLGSLLMGMIMGGVLFTNRARLSPTDLHLDAAQLKVFHYDTHHPEGFTHNRRCLHLRYLCAILFCFAWLMVLLGLFLFVEKHVNQENAREGQDVWCPGCDKFQCADTSSWSCKPLKYYY